MTHADLRQQPLSQLLQAFYDRYGLKADGDDCGDEAKDVLGIVGAVGSVDDTVASVGLDSALLDDLLKGEAVADQIKP